MSSTRNHLVRPFAVAIAAAGLASFIVASLSGSNVRAQEMTPANTMNIPADAGVLNVRDAKYGAVGDGVTDDTAAIQAALSEALDSHRIVYLPDGTYLVSDTLKWWREGYNIEQVNGWGAFMQLQGQSEAGTILKLKDAADGFNDPANPKAVVATGSRGYHGSKGYKSGEGNEAFENNLRSFSVDTGKGNAGAVGIDYQVSNFGSLRNVTIRSGDGAGAVGLSMARRDNGPGIVTHLTIVGFDIGIKVAGGVCQLSYEHVTLRNQKQVGLHVHDAVVAVRKLMSENGVPAASVGGLGLLNILDSSLTGGEAASAAVVNRDDESALTLAGVTTSGYAALAENRGDRVSVADAGAIWSSDGTQSAFKSEKAPPRIEVRDTPVMPAFAPADWVSIGASNGRDDADAIERAMASGKPVVYLPYANYKTTRPIEVPPTVKAIVGFGSSIDLVQPKPNPDDALFVIRGGARGDTLWIDRLIGHAKGQFIVDHGSPRTLVLRDVSLWDSKTYRNRAGAGTVFADGVGGVWRIDHPTDVFARNFNIEGAGDPKVTLASGARLWALGFKNEAAATMLVAHPGSHFEGWGGLAYTFGADPKAAAIVLDGATALVSLAGMTFVPDGYYQTLVRETRDGQTKVLRKVDAFPRGGAAVVPLYVAAPKATAAARATR